MLAKPLLEVAVNTMYVLQWYDYFLFAITLLVCLGIGIYFACVDRGQRSPEEYLHGERKLLAVPVGASIALSSISAVHVIGGSAETYEHGAQRFVDLLGVMVGLTLAYLLFIPMFYNLKITSLFQVGHYLIVAQNSFLQIRYIVWLCGQLPEGWAITSVYQRICGPTCSKERYRVAQYIIKMQYIWRQDVISRSL